MLIGERMDKHCSCCNLPENVVDCDGRLLDLLTSRTFALNSLESPDGRCVSVTKLVISAL